MHNYQLSMIDVLVAQKYECKSYAILHVFDMFGDFTTGPVVQDCM